MKLKMIAVACATLSAGVAFAAAPTLTCSTATLAGLVNTCQPDVVFYMGGASAQSPALNAVLAAGGNGIFDTSAVRGKITLNSTVNGNGNTVGYIGKGAVGTAYAGKNVLVIYNKLNGSAAGVGQLLATIKTATEATTLQTVTAAMVKSNTAGTCTVVEPASAGALGSATCTTEANFASGWGKDAQKVMHLALSDVKPSELAPGGLVNGTKAIAWAPAKFPATVTGVQGFGVIVNPALYTALIAQQVANGSLPAACASSETVGGATDVVSLACQPNLTKAAYAGLVTGSITTADALLGTSGDTHALSLARRGASSGTQAASNIFFANQAAYVAKTPTTDGFLDPVVAGTYGTMVVTEQTGTGGVITAVSGNTTGYALGVVSLENAYSMTKASSALKGALFVKIDGISPNLVLDASGNTVVDAKQRAGLQTGYPFAFQMQAIKSADLAAKAANQADIATKIVAGLTDPAQNLTGIAYIGSSDAAKNTAFTRSGGNNYLPLIKN